MKSAAEMERDNEALRERLTRLSQASLCINESLDYPTVLQGVLDSARSLTGAGYGVMTFLDDSGVPRDFLSSGMTVEEDGRLWDLPEGVRIYEYLGSFSSPLRLPDLLGHLRSQGLPELRQALPVGPVLPFLGAPIFHRGERAGKPLPGRQGSRRGVHPGRRGDPGHVRLPGRPGDCQRPHVPGRAAGPDRPGDPDPHLPGGRGRLRREDGSAQIVQPGGEKDRRWPAEAGPIPGGSAPDRDLPAQRRAGGLPAGVPHDPGIEYLGDGARRGDRHAGARRSVGHHADQCHAHLLGRRRNRLLCGDPAGPGPAGGAGAAAGRVPRHGQPRAARSADLHQGFGRHRAGRPVRAQRRRDGPPVLPHHQSAGRPHERPDKRLAGRGPHGDRNLAGQPRTDVPGGAGGQGPHQLPEQRGSGQPADRTAPRSSPRAGGPAAHRPGPGQPAVQRRPACAQGHTHPGFGGAGGGPRGGHGFRPGPGRASRAAAPPVPQVPPARGTRPRGGELGGRPGPGHLPWASWKPTEAASGRKAKG